jgi:hypothetical protein
VKKNLPPSGQTKIAQILSKNNPVPLLQPINGEELAEDGVKLIKTYVVVSDETALAIFLWCALTWCHEEFVRCPLLLINAPERACGKSQLLKLVEFLVRGPFATGNITMASLFRIVAQYNPTLLIDEADTFINGKSEMMGVINNGYERGGCVVRVESDGKNMDVKTYDVYGPKALAGISLERHLPDATLSRGIQVPMRRKTRDEEVARLRSASADYFANMRSRIARFVQDHRETLAQGWNDMPEALDDRAQDNCEPLLAIAHCLGPSVYEKAVAAFISIQAETEPPKSASNQLLNDIREVLKDWTERYISSHALLTRLEEHPDMDWCTYNHGQMLTSVQLSKYMKAYGIKTKSVRVKGQGKGTPKGFELRHFNDAFNRYLEDPVVDDEDDGMPEADAPEADTPANPPDNTTPDDESAAF